jgi:hypothetical protein
MSQEPVGYLQGDPLQEPVKSQEPVGALQPDQSQEPVEEPVVSPMMQQGVS